MISPKHTTRPQLRAIPTEYAGTQFKSRFEANTAQQFDKCGWPWQYEPQSFLLRSGHYWPDFYLPEQRLWVECRGYEGKDQQLFEFADGQALLVLRWSGYGSFLWSNNADLASWHFCLGCSKSYIYPTFQAVRCPHCQAAPPEENTHRENLHYLQAIVEVRSGVVGCNLISSIAQVMTPLSQTKHSLWDPLGYWHECEIPRSAEAS